MKIIHINTYSDFGGAGIACQRISDSINQISPGTSEVFDKKTSENNFHFFREKPFPEKITYLNFAIDTLWAWFLGVKKRNRFSFSLSKWGREIEKWDLVRKADIIHLHWINQGFISLNGLKKIARLGKPVVWTLHDMWPLTGGCHYSGDCDHFIEGCKNCYLLRNSGPEDLSFKGSNEKTKIFKILKPFLISPSQWLSNLAQKSHITSSYSVKVIPNPINLDIFKPGNRNEIREKLSWGREEFVIVINAFKISNERKGFAFLLEAIKIIEEKALIPIKSIRLAIIGEMDANLLMGSPISTSIFGYLKDEAKIIEINQAADVYVLPSLEDNLPNTILEALGCGLPSVAFRVGGIPDLIDHLETGYLSEPKSSSSLAEGIAWVYNQSKNSTALTTNSRKKALETYNYKKIGESYLEVYNRMLMNYK